MGWFQGADDDPETYEHEGHVQGVVRDGFDWRDLGIDDVRDDTRLMQVQVCCTCGWRSRRYTAPLGTYWSPCSVQLRDEGTEDAAAAIWQAHRVDVGATGDLWNLAHTLRFGPSAKVAP